MPHSFAALALLGWLALQAPAAQPAAPPSTDIYELTFSGAAADLKNAKPRPVSTTPGYDNQPHYTPDGGAILFTANRDGKQMDIYQFDRQASRVTPLIATPEGEYSPTVTPDGQGISVIRVEADGTQRLWRFDRKGANPRLVLTDIKPVGYHAWIDADRLALFVLGKPATLQLANAGTGKAEVIANDIGRSLHRIPGSNAISFVQREGEKQFSLRRLDPATRAVRTLTAMPAESSDRDMAWLPDGTVLASAGPKILAWKEGASAWRDVFDVTPHKLGNVTRMAASPDGKSIAIVVAER